MFLTQKSQEWLNRFAPNSQGRHVWSLARTSLNVKVTTDKKRKTAEYATAYGTNISGTDEWICDKYTGKICLDPRSDKFKRQRSRSPGTKYVQCSVQIERTCCKQRHASVDGTILSLPGVTSVACVQSMFGKTSLALVS